MGNVQYYWKIETSNNRAFKLAKEKQTAWNFARERKEAGRADGDQAAEVGGKTGEWFLEGGTICSETQWSS